MGSLRKSIGLAALILTGIFMMVTIGMIIGKSRIISPVPEEGAIRIIYISPSPTGKTTPGTTPIL